MYILNRKNPLNLIFVNTKFNDGIDPISVLKGIGAFSAAEFR